MVNYMRGSRKFCKRGPKFDIFLVDEGILDQNTAIYGPSSTHQRNAIEMTFRWRADDGPTLNAGLLGSFVIFQGIRTSIANKPYIFVIFRGSPDPLSPPPLDPPMHWYFTFKT